MNLAYLARAIVEPIILAGIVWVALQYFMVEFSRHDDSHIIVSNGFGLAVYVIGVIMLIGKKSFWSALLSLVGIGRINYDRCLKIAEQEYETQTFVEETWRATIDSSGGDEAKRKYLYIQARVRDLINSRW